MGFLNMTSDPYLCILQRVLRIGNTSEACNNVKLLRIGNTPKACNNVKSNDLDANRLLFEHVKMQKNTNLLRSNNTRSNKSLVRKDDDTSAGSDVFQPEELVQFARDVVSNMFGSLTYKVFHF